MPKFFVTKNQRVSNQMIRTHPVGLFNLLNLSRTERSQFYGEVINAKYAILQRKKHTEKRIKVWKVVGKVLKTLKVQINSS